MKTLLMTTALVAATSFGAIAQTTTGATAPAMTNGATDQVHATHVPGFRASDFMGMTVYALDNEAVRAPQADASARWMSGDSFMAERDQWENVGSVDDIVMSQDGEVRGILLDVGGFLGIGARSVMVSIDDLYFVADSESAEELNDFFVVASLSREALENLPEWDSANLQQGFEHGGAPMTEPGATMGYDNTQTQTGGTDTGLSMDPRTTVPDGYAVMDTNERTVENLTGANVYDAAGDDIGSVDDLVLDGNDGVSHVLVDVGGFLGIGAHTVALSVDDVDVIWNDADGDVRVQAPMTREQLEAMPEYQG